MIYLYIKQGVTYQRVRGSTYTKLWQYMILLNNIIKKKKLVERAKVGHGSL